MWPIVGGHQGFVAFLFALFVLAWEFTKLGSLLDGMCRLSICDVQRRKLDDRPSPKELACIGI